MGLSELSEYMALWLARRALLRLAIWFVCVCLLWQKCTVQTL